MDQDKKLESKKTYPPGILGVGGWVEYQLIHYVEFTLLR
jgi:hypothetical protein